MRMTCLAPILGIVILATDSAAASNPFSGLWEGLAHGSRGDQAIAVALRPRGPMALAGMVYLDGAEFGAIEDGRWNGDSLTFRATSYPFFGEVRSNTMTLTLAVPRGARHDFTLSHTSADTTRLPALLQPAAEIPAVIADPAPDSVFAAHARSPETEPEAAPCMRHGTLLLVGGGPTQPDLMRRFVRLAGGDAARIVVIPTAHAEHDDRDAIQRYGPTAARILGVPGVSVLHTFSRREADSDAFTSVLRGATGVWIDGGEPLQLLNAYLGTRTERELVALLDRGGVIGGTSAGAVIWGSRSVVYRAPTGVRSYRLPSADDMMLGDRREPNFGVLRNVVVSAHFTEFHQLPAAVKLLALHPHDAAIGIDEATAVEVHGDTCSVLGRGHVTLLQGPSPTPRRVLGQGARFDLRTLDVL